jgi:hypothetical protein
MYYDYMGSKFIHNIQAVEVTGYKPAAFDLELLKTLETLGFKNAVLHGGALRDSFLGYEEKIKDRDIWVNFGTPPLEAPPNHFVDMIATVFPGAKNIHSTPLEHTSDRTHAWGKIEFDYQGKLVDLFMTTVDYNLQSKALESDAPINSIAMNSEGRVLAHPQFKNHARHKIYVPHPQVPESLAIERFERLCQKIPGLKRSDTKREENLSAKPLPRVPLRRAPK